MCVARARTVGPWDGEEAAGLQRHMSHMCAFPTPQGCLSFSWRSSRGFCNEALARYPANTAGRRVLFRYQEFVCTVSQRGDVQDEVDVHCLLSRAGSLGFRKIHQSPVQSVESQTRAECVVRLGGRVPVGKSKLRTANAWGTRCG